MKDYFYKKVNKKSLKAMWNFLVRHPIYLTLNNWNGLYSIANNVKIYNLDLEGDKWLALGLIRNDDYQVINNMLQSWENEHNGYKLGFNGRSGGYIVMYSEDYSGNVLPNWLTKFTNFETFNETYKDFVGDKKYVRGEMEYYTELVQSFDKLCDEIRDYVNDLSLTNKGEMVDEELERLTEDFNWQYGDDLAIMQIDDLEVKRDEKGSYVDISQLTKSNSLFDCFENCLRQYDNSISLYSINWDEDHNILRLKYNG